MIDAMPKPRLPHLLREFSNRGRHVWYFRIGKGQRIRLPDEYDSPEFRAAYAAALAGAPLPMKRAAVSGSVAWLIGRYKESSNWLLLAPATRYQRDRIFTGIIEKIGNESFHGITAKSIRQGRENRKHTPFMANNYLKAVKGLCAWAVEDEKMDEDPSAGIKELPVETKGHEPWTADDMRKYEKRWPIGERERVWFDVLRYTGLRLGDACTVGKQHAGDGEWIRLRVEKTGEELAIPILPALAATIKAGPTADLAWISNAYGKPFVKEAFGNAFRDACKAAGITGKSAHGLRKSLASLAAEMGASEEEMQSWFGWRSNRMSKIYTRAASKKKMAGNLGDKLAANEKGTKSPRASVSRAGKRGISN